MSAETLLSQLAQHLESKASTSSSGNIDVLQEIFSWSSSRLADERSGFRSNNLSAIPSKFKSTIVNEVPASPTSIKSGNYSQPQLNVTYGPGTGYGAAEPSPVPSSRRGSVQPASLKSQQQQQQQQQQQPPQIQVPQIQVPKEQPRQEPSMFNSNPFGTLNVEGNALQPVNETGATKKFSSPVNSSLTFPPSYALGRRTSVSAESLIPTSRHADGGSSAVNGSDHSSASKKFQLPKYPKTAQQYSRIKASIANNFLFRNLDDEQERDVLDAMKEMRFSENEKVIQQGAVGDFFYVVEEGSLDVYVHKDHQVYEDDEGDGVQDLGNKVHTCTPGTSFGELALMYNAPRAASIIANQSCILWALDRITFRTILLDSTSRKRKMYESFLSTVTILGTLEPYERAKIADALEQRQFGPGESVVKEGEVGEEFYIIESGKAVVTKRMRGDNGRFEDVVVGELGKGDYFGELALINRAPRAATVRAASETGTKLKLAALGEKAFTRLLGPTKDIMARKAGERYGTN